MAQVTSLYGNNVDQLSGQLFASVDSAANDSDKTLTVPTGQTWRVECVNCTFATTADVGNRQIALVVSDGTNTLGTFQAEANQAASLTEYYAYSPHYATASEAPTSWHYIPLPCYTLGPGYTIRVYDTAAVAAAGDDLTVVVSGIAF
jgi:hypothetical protein